MKNKMLVFMMLLLMSCTVNINTSKLYVKTLTVTEIDDKETREEPITVINTDYIEISLMSMQSGKIYSAQRKIEYTYRKDYMKLVQLYITDEKGETILFKNSTDFLNFMSDKGYEMVDQQKSKYQTDYTFKKK